SISGFAGAGAAGFLGDGAVEEEAESFLFTSGFTSGAGTCWAKPAAVRMRTKKNERPNDRFKSITGLLRETRIPLVLVALKNGLERKRQRLFLSSLTD